jgi:hypothetical protein
MTGTTGTTGCVAGVGVSHRSTGEYRRTHADAERTGP